MSSTNGDRVCLLHDFRPTLIDLDGGPVNVACYLPSLMTGNGGRRWGLVCKKCLDLRRESIMSQDVPYVVHCASAAAWFGEAVMIIGSAC